MNIIKVIPITRGISKENLSYFTSIDVPIGSIVRVPVRKKIVNGFVISKENATVLKSEIKSSSFVIKKIEKLSATKFLSPEFVKSAEHSAEFFATSTSAILNAMIPKSILDNVGKTFTQKNPPNAQGSYQKLVIQTNDEERFANYKSLIREEFARKSSVFFCVPTISDIQKTKSILEKGIEKYTFMLHGSLRKKDAILIWNKILEKDHPVLIIATGPYLCIPREDIKTIIIERENSRSYKTQTRPFLDIRTFAEFLAKETKSKILFGDILLRTETLWREQNEEILPFAPLKFRSLTTAEQVLVDMKEKKDSSEKKFQIISNELAELIQTNKENNENLFIFAARRGLSSTTVCGDCGHTVSCKTCNAPTTLHGGTENFFLCHRCGEKRNAKEFCAICGSWKLTTLGVGIETVEKELKEKFSQIKVFVLDKDKVKTHEKAMVIVNEFNNTPGSILLGTEMALLYINKKIENASVVSIDSLFSIPDFRITEKILYILLNIRAIAQKKFILQTRNAEQNILEYALKGNLVDFYREEIEARKTFGYPPFNVLIKITLQGQKLAVTKEMEKLETIFGRETIITFPAFVPLAKGKYTMHGLIKIAREKWVDKEILGKLLSLPPQSQIKVDPESLL